MDDLISRKDVLHELDWCDYGLKDWQKWKLKMMVRDIPLAQSEQRWIPTSEKLPEDDTPVLVYLFESNSPYIAWVSDCEWFTEEFQIEKESEPKAWMPLPDAYEEDD